MMSADNNLIIWYDDIITQPNIHTWVYDTTIHTWVYDTKIKISLIPIRKVIFYFSNANEYKLR